MLADFPTPGYALFGFVAGLFGSLLGLGGGWLMVPAMTATGMSTVVSVGTSLAAMIATTTVSTVKYHRQGILVPKLGLAFGVPAAAGVTVGKALLTRLAALGLADTAVGVFYVALLLFQGVSMLRGKRKTAGGPPSRLPAFGPSIAYGEHRIDLVYAALTGSVAGVLSGVLGIGGGILLVPVMAGVFGLPVIAAVATSLVSVLVSATCGAVSYGLAGAWAPAVAVWLALGAVAGGFIGATLAPDADERVLRRLFAALTLVTATSLTGRLAGYRDASFAVLFAGAGGLGLVALAVLVSARRRRRAEGGVHGVS